MPEMLCLSTYGAFGIGAESLVEAVEGALRSVSKTPKMNRSLYLNPILMTEEEFVIIIKLLRRRKR
jgi:hypothetical protein